MSTLFRAPFWARNTPYPGQVEKQLNEIANINVIGNFHNPMVIFNQAKLEEKDDTTTILEPWDDVNLPEKR